MPIVGHVSASAGMDIGISGSVVIAKEAAANFPAMPGEDMLFFVSGNTQGTSAGEGVAGFGGQVYFSGTTIHQLPQFFKGYNTTLGNAIGAASTPETNGVTLYATTGSLIVRDPGGKEYQLASGSIASVDNNVNNRLVTATGTGLNGEANLTFDGTDVSLAGQGKIEFGATSCYINHDGTDLQLVDDADINIKPGADLLVDAGGNIIIDAGGTNNTINFRNTGTTYLQMSASSGHCVLSASVNEKDIIFHGDDAAEVFRLDGSAKSLLMASDKKIELGGANCHIDGDGTDLNIDSGGNITLTSTVDEAAAIKLRANGGTSEQILLHSDQGTAAAAATETDASIMLKSDAGGIGLYSALNAVNAISIEANGGTSENIRIHSNQGTSATAGAASIQLTSDVGGVHLLSGLDGANAIVIKANGGTSETIVIHADQGNGDGSIKLSSDDGGITLETNSSKNITVNTAAILPDSDDSTALGSASKRFSDIFTGDLHLRNDRGNWTLIEEPGFISFRDNTTGKRYKMLMQEITGDGSYGPGNDGVL